MIQLAMAHIIMQWWVVMTFTVLCATLQLT
jgi:hypothetical protein